MLNSQRKMLKLSIGWDDSINVPNEPKKSLSKASTFPATGDRKQLESILGGLCSELECTLGTKMASTIVFKYQTDDFETRSKSIRIRKGVDLKSIILPILDSIGRPIRMMSVAASQLHDAPKRTFDSFCSKGVSGNDLVVAPAKRVKKGPLAKYFK